MTQPKVTQTPTGWLAVGLEYPRIGVTAPTREGVLVEFERQRAEWLLLREVPTHDCSSCDGSNPALDHWNDKSGHWYCPHGNDNCARHIGEDR